MADQAKIRLLNRVKKIHDALEADNVKTATKFATALADEFPQSVLAKTVMADVLVHSGKRAEAEKLTDEIIKSEQNADDDSVFRRLTIILTKLGRGDQMVALCLKGWEKFKDSKSSDHAKFYGEELFAAYARKGQLDEQKKLAFVLSQKFKDNKYRQWGVVSQAMLAKKSDPSKTGMVTTLANRMFEKHLEESENPTTQEVLFYVQLLNDQNEVQKAISVVDGPLGKKVFKIERQRIEKLVELKRILKQWSEVRALLKNLLETEMENEDWKWYTGLFEATFALISQDSANSTLLSDVYSILEQCRASPTQSIKRGIGMAVMEFEKLLLEQDRKRSPDDIFGLALQFFRHNAVKPSIFRDIRPYLIVLDKRQMGKKFIEEVFLHVGAEPKGAVNACYTRVAFEKIRKSLSVAESIASKKQIAKSLLKAFQDSLPLKSVAKIEATDRGHGDDFLLLAVHYLLDGWSESGQDSVLVDCIVLLEKGLKESSYNFAFKLLLIKLYNYFGAIQKSCEIFFSLDIKHIQFETIAHFVFDDCVKNLAQNDLSKLFKETSKLQTDEIDIRVPMRITDAYRSGAFTMITEFSTFLDRMQNSIHWAATKTEAIHNTLLTKCSTIDDIAKFLEVSAVDIKSGAITIQDVEKLWDNYDWKVIDRFDLDENPDAHSLPWPKLLHHSAMTALTSQTIPGIHSAQKQLLRYRNIILRIIGEMLTEKKVTAETEKLFDEAYGTLHFDSASVDAFLGALILNQTRFLIAVSLLAIGYRDGKTENDVKVAHDSLQKETSALLQLLQGISSVSSSVPWNGDVSIFHHVLEGFTVLVVSLSVSSSLFPKRFNKQADDAMKELYKSDKKAFSDALAAAKEAVTRTQGAIEAAASSSVRALSLPEDSVASSSLSEGEVSAVLEQVNLSVATARKIAMQRLLECVKDRNRILQSIKA